MSYHHKHPLCVLPTKKMSKHTQDVRGNFTVSIYLHSDSWHLSNYSCIFCFSSWHICTASTSRCFVLHRNNGWYSSGLPITQILENTIKFNKETGTTNPHTEIVQVTDREEIEETVLNNEFTSVSSARSNEDSHLLQRPKRSLILFNNSCACMPFFGFGVVFFCMAMSILSTYAWCAFFSFLF